ncbi:MAG: hypothetical protein ACREDO_00310 [Methyloceanibacter sp.]
MVRRLILSVLFATPLVGVGMASPASALPGDGPPNVWTGPLKDAVPGACPNQYLPVHDVKGNTYTNATCARL